MYVMHKCGALLLLVQLVITSLLLKPWVRLMLPLQIQLCFFWFQMTFIYIYVNELTRNVPM